MTPKSPPNVREVIRWIARLGGFLARKGDGEPGPTTLWRGYLRNSESHSAMGALREGPALLGGLAIGATSGTTRTRVRVTLHKNTSKV